MTNRINLLDQMIAERSLADFIRQAWSVLEPKTPYLENWHHGYLAEVLEALASGEILKLIINISPRYGKSLLASVFFPCWNWLRDPSARFLFASYSSVLATKHSVDRRGLLQSRWFTDRWGDRIRLAPDANLKTDFSNMQRGHMIATSVGASATGRGGNFLICDDLINPEQADSDIERVRAIRWFDETFSTRQDDKKTGRQMIIEQRTHAADLTGHLLAEEGWFHIALPAIAERKTIITLPRSRQQVIRDEGYVLWPMREDRAELNAARQRLGGFAFQAQYQQDPTAREGNLIKREWLTATWRTLPPRFDSLLLALDTAYKTGATNDYSAAVVIGTLRAARDGCLPGHYLIDCWRGKLEFAGLKRKVIELHETWHPHAVLVEDSASGQSLLQELRAGTTLPLKPIKPDHDKYQRVAAITPVLEARLVLLPETAWWREDFITELTSFPAGAHDDWCDAFAMALNHLRNEKEPGAITFLKLEQAAAWVREGIPIETATMRANLTAAELQRWIAREVQPRGPHSTNSTVIPYDDDDPRVPVFRHAAKLIEAFRSGHTLTGLDSSYYHSYLRHVLLTFSDPDAAKLISFLDRTP
jgi:predicted phage terminase large subunit-like protein